MNCVKPIVMTETPREIYLSSNDYKAIIISTPRIVTNPSIYINKSNTCVCVEAILVPIDRWTLSVGSTSSESSTSTAAQIVSNSFIACSFSSAINVT